jgi:hypothetical protein
MGDHDHDEHGGHDSPTPPKGTPNLPPQPAPGPVGSPPARPRPPVYDGRCTTETPGADGSVVIHAIEDPRIKLSVPADRAATWGATPGVEFFLTVTPSQ